MTRPDITTPPIPERRPDPSPPLIDLLRQAMDGAMSPGTGLTSLFDRMERVQ